MQVQRPFVLETVSLDLFLGRQLGRFVRNFPALSSRLDIVAILDQFAQNFYQVHVALRTCTSLHFSHMSYSAARAPLLLINAGVGL